MLVNLTLSKNCVESPSIFSIILLSFSKRIPGDSNAGIDIGQNYYVQYWRVKV